MDKKITFENCCPVKHGFALQNYYTYMQDIGAMKTSGHKRIYGGKNYITIIRQTKTTIFVRVA